MRIIDWSSDVCSSDLDWTGCCGCGAAPKAVWAAWGGVIRGSARLWACCGAAALARGCSTGAVRPSRSRPEIGRAEGRERVCQYVEIAVVAVSLNKKKHKSKNQY